MIGRVWRIYLQTILKEVRKGKKVINYKVTDEEVVRKAIEDCYKKYNKASESLVDKYRRLGIMQRVLRIYANLI